MPHAGEYVTSPSFSVGGAIRSRSVSGGVGYANGAGGTVVQATSKSTAVTLDTICGRIRMNAANLAANTAVSFTWTNSSAIASDSFAWGQRGGTDGAYALTFTPSAGSVVVTLRNLTAGALAEAFEFNFAILRTAVV